MDPTLPLKVRVPFACIVLLVWSFPAAAQQTRWPSTEWTSADASDVNLDATRLDDAVRYALSAGGSGMIIRHGQVVSRWGDQKQRYDIKSSTKSFGATMLGVAIMDGKIDLDTPATRYHPSFAVPPDANRDPGWIDKITIRHLATQTAGFDKPGGYERLLFPPGTKWHYSDGGPNWLAECITLQYGRDLQEVMFERVFTPIGITPRDLHWRQNQYRNHEIDGVARREFGAGIHCNVDALARVAYLYLHDGTWKNQQILPTGFVTLATGTSPSVAGLPEYDSTAHGNASDHYGLLWWNNVDGSLSDVPRDAFWSWGLYDSLMIVLPSLDMVVVRAGQRGRQWKRTDGANHYDVLRPFLDPIVAAAKQSGGNEQSSQNERSSGSPRAPYPPSELVKDVHWSPPSTIVRLADGSDNWPITWADDGQLYSAYGDGWGFEPNVEKKLSLGLAKVLGNPDDLQGINIRSVDAERLGQGSQGIKASGMLMIDGVLYMLVRNANNAQLAWSDDHGQTWTWADWKWSTSFGCPTFLNFGRNYAGARDDFVYIYSPDSDSAYEPADAMVLARVPKTKIQFRASYEFFGGLDRQGGPTWSTEIRRRKSVFTHPARCYRGGIIYNNGLKRYLWCQTLPESTDPRGPRFQGGFGIYEAPEPWGPWRTVYFTESWDVGPGETSSFPTKWISDDGKTMHLLFSGNDHFSVRKVTLVTR